MIIREMRREDRPQEKLFFYGKESLSNRELLSLVLRSGTKDRAALDVADELLSLDPKGLGYLAGCSPEELKKVRGVGTAKAAALLASLELGKRLSSEDSAGRVWSVDPDEAGNFFLNRMRFLEKECFYAALLDTGYHLVGLTEIAAGDAHSVIAAPSQIYREAVKRGAAAIVVAHNHPSGDPSPSEADLVTTKKLQDAGKILGVTLFDHIIVGGGTFVSLRGSGFLDDEQVT